MDFSTSEVPFSQFETDGMYFIELFDPGSYWNEKVKGKSIDSTEKLIKSVERSTQIISLFSVK